jgi:hypothetical protein
MLKTETRCPMRPELQALPARMAEQPIDERGYPVPWFVAWMDDKPEFRAMDPMKFLRAIKEKLCWVCGQKLGVNVTFVAGPMCGINRTSSEPPNHQECARYSARNCPFLNNPRMVRREDDLSLEIAGNVAGIAIRRNPGVTMLWNTRQYEIFKTETGPLIQLGEPESVEWLACGRTATRDEVIQSIESGISNLENVARLEKGGLEALAQARKRFERWLPTGTI